MNSIILRWVAVGLLTMMAAGCATNPSGNARYLSSNGNHGYDSTDLDNPASTGGFNKENYYYSWFLKTADGTCYQRIEYYITEPSDDTKLAYYPCPQPHPPGQSDRKVYTEEYGYYVCITHPPGRVVCGVIIRITHPPGTYRPDRSK